MAFFERKHSRLTARAAKLALVYLTAWPLIAAAAVEPAVIPNPAEMIRLDGQFNIDGKTVITIPAKDAEAKQSALLLSALIWQTQQTHLAVQTGAPRKNAINLVRDRSGGNAEAYRLEVRADGVTLSAHGASGLLYGAMSLWQLAQKNRDGVFVPAIKIADQPRFQWRGVMLDSARHFQSPEFIRQFIDWMALHKLNVLHWHLTDDQAWRIEIRQYPRLTSVGAWRVPAGPAAQADIDPATGKPRLYGGFYSQKTVRGLVAHAKTRGITIVPEIEMPGHATAPLAAYPALAATGEPPKSPSPDWGIHSNVYNLDESTFTFLENVLTEVMALFPSKYIHVGGDEVEKAQWKASPAVQNRMRELGIKDPAGIQIYFTQRIGRFLEKHQRHLIGWDEILEPGLPAKAVVMSWRGIDGALAAAGKGHDTVLSPWPTLYFDNLQRVWPDEPPGRGRVISLEDVYRFEPMSEKLMPSERRHVLGLQANVWTEHIRTEERAATMTFPRAAAIAELGWSQPEKRDWTDFMRRLGVQFSRYDALKMPYSDSAFAPQIETQYAGGSPRVSVSVANQTKRGEFRYTVDGTEPSPQSAKYTGPLMLAIPAELRVAAFDGESRLSRTRALPLKRELATRRATQQLKLCSENIALSMEDDAPIKGPRATFLVDVQSPCWIYTGADLDAASDVVAAVGQVPFNFQIGDLIKQIQFPTPVTPAGELEVHLDDCKGEIIARLPLAPALGSNAVTTLPAVPIGSRSGRHDLCLRFAQTFVDPLKDPLWVIDWFQLIGREPSPVASGLKP